MKDDLEYEPLTSKTLPDRLKNLASVTSLIGKQTEEWKVTEVGDGNLNLVFVVHPKEPNFPSDQREPATTPRHPKTPGPLG